jgi:hypothetical protein
LSQDLAYGMSLRFEIYRKEIRSLQPRFENLFDPLVVLPEVRPDRVRIDAGAALARGAELMLSQRRRDGALRWWASYTWSEVFDSLPIVPSLGVAWEF